MGSEGRFHDSLSPFLAPWESSLLVWPWMQDPGAKGVQCVPSRDIQEEAEEVGLEGGKHSEGPWRGVKIDRTQSRQEATWMGELEEEEFGGWEVEVEDCRKETGGLLETTPWRWHWACDSVPLTVSLTQTGLNQPGPMGVKQLRYTQKCVNLASHTFVTF